MLKFRNISKKYGEKTAVDDLSFEINAGRIFGLLGPNGAGKTTLIRILLGIINSDRGEIFYNDKLLAPEKMQPIFGYLPEERGLYKKSRAEDILRYFAVLKNVPSTEIDKRIGFWLNKLSIEKLGNRKIEELSKGNQQKVQLISALIHNPRILVLDEPFSGLDPLNQNLALEIINDFISEKNIVIISTHLMEIAEKLCEDIIFINKGRKIIGDSLENIIAENSADEYIIQMSESGVEINFMRGQITAIEGNRYIVTPPNGWDAERLLGELSGNYPVVSFVKKQNSLKDIFIKKIEESE